MSRPIDRKGIGIYFICELVVFGMLILVPNEAHAACPVHTVSSQAAQTCFTGIAFMNSTVHSMEEICRMYTETLYCVKRILHNEGLDCNLHDIGISLSVFYTTLGPKIRITVNANKNEQNISFNHPVEPEVTSICSSEERLSQYTLIACGPYLDQMQFIGDSYGACVYSASLVECADKSMGFLGVTCSKVDIENAFKSQSATSYLARHVQGLDLKTCFKTVSVNEDKNCVNYVTIFSYGNITTCMTGLSNINLTDNMDSQDRNMQCSYVQELEACMIKQLQGTGSHCTMAQMKSALNTYIHLSAGMGSNLDLLTQCPENANYVSTSMCKDNFRLVSFLYASTAMRSLEGYNNKDLVCTLVISYANVLMKSLDISCSTSQIFSALTSQLGTSITKRLYPQLDFNHCVTGTTTNAQPVTGSSAHAQSDGIRSYESRKRRNAVAVKDWLWKDNKIPYVIDKSEFSKQ